ncbi:MAG: hypothetical protein V3U65_19795 [Granulosicoccaceae bacterium]
MLGLVKIVDSGPLSAALMAAGLFVFGIALQTMAPAASMLSLLMYVFSTSVVCFVVLRRGESAVLHVLAMAFVALFVVSIVVLKAGLILPLSAFVFWVAGIVVAVVLRRTVDLSISTLAAAACGALAFAGVMLFAPDLAEQWIKVVKTSLESMSAADKARFPVGQLEKITNSFARMLPSAIGLSVMLVAVGSVYIARWWQASIVNPGGFQKEFHGLRYGRFIALGGLGLIAIAISVGGANGIALASLVIVCFFIQGLSVAHALVKQRGMSQAWLVGIYLLMILPQTILLLGALGMSDNIYSLRKTTE